MNKEELVKLLKQCKAIQFGHFVLRSGAVSDYYIDIKKASTDPLILKKIAEAMAMGMAIVSTSQGVRGFPLIHGENVLIADDNTEFARYCIELLVNPYRREHMGKAARETALGNIDWRVLGIRLNMIIGSA